MRDIIGHCPYCTKILFKDAVFIEGVNFETNCHHCGKPIIVEVQKEIIIIVKPRIQVKLPPEKLINQEKIDSV